MRAGPRALRRLFALAMVLALVVPAVGVMAQSGNETYFDQVWARTDGPVATGNASRSWVWGPTKYGEARMEPYTESPGGERLVQYFDKSRMEITNPSANPASEWYVTNGLLVVELITGQMQVGDFDFEEREPAEVNVAGDSDDPLGPTYATFGELLDAPATPAGWLVTNRVDREANVTDDPSLANYEVTVAEIDEVTGHSIAMPFWEFMHASGVIWSNSSYVTGQLFQNPLFALGRPITEPYWATVAVAGTQRDVLLQCFERRCVTYTPGNPDGWEVEAGNVGRHYFNWRYDTAGPVDPEPVDPVIVMTCDDFTYQEEAQNFFNQHFNDPDYDVTALLDLDAGMACPNLPPEPLGLSCADFVYQEDAQEYFDEYGGSPENNVDGLDDNGDGIACEDLPNRPVEPTPPPGGGGGGGGGGGFDPLPPSRP